MVSVKQATIRVMSRWPVYRALPPGAARTYATLKFHGQHSTRAELAQLVRSMDGIPTRYFSTAIVAARAAFRSGQDDLLNGALDALERRFPEHAAVPVLRCDLFTFAGDYQPALACARRARLLEPSSATAAARLVRLSYLVQDRAQADAVAVREVERFPRSAEVLWAAARACSSADQYSRLRAVYRDRDPADAVAMVRQLAMAATRARQLAEALTLYRDAIAALTWYGRRPRPALRQLSGRGAWAAIDDLRQTLDRAGVPYFFAAGTALGLVREGRPIGADNDIDVGIFDEDWDRSALVDLFARDPRFELDPHPLSEKVCLRHRGAAPIDLFRYYPREGRVWHDGVFVRWWNTPFQVVRRDVTGLQLPLPDDADRYLTENYGDWRVPNPAFDPFTEQAPNVEVFWPEYQRLHLVRRAYKQLTVGNVAGARSSLQRADVPDLVDRTEASA